MKERVFIVVLMALMSMPIMARDAIKVVNGDLSVFNNPGIVATVKFDYTDLQIEGKPYMEHLKSRGSDFVRDWPSESQTSENYFVKCWNHDNEDGMQLTTATGKEYTMVFVVTEMDMGSGAASMLVGFGAGGAKMSGMMYILKGNSDVPVLTVSIDGQSGRSGMTEIARRVDLYGELAEDMVETLQKTKQSKVPASTEAVVIPSKGGKSTTKATASSSKSVSKVEAKKSETSNGKQKKAVSASQKNAAVSKSSNARLKVLKEAKGEIIPRRRKPILGDFELFEKEDKIGLYFDFSAAQIMERSEEEFISYMSSPASGKDRDPQFSETWENTIKPELESLFCEIVNSELREEDCGIRFVSDINCDYVLKVEVLELDDDANNIINFLFVNMQTGNVDAQIKCESKGGRMGRYVGLLNQGFESAGENFAEMFLDQID